MNDSGIVRLASDAAGADIHLRGAEVRHFGEPGGPSWLHDGDPAWWHGIAPLLFPVVGAVVDDRISIGGRHYPMRKHGLARTSAFAVVDQGADHVLTRLTDSADSRTSYPFGFALDVGFRLTGRTLRQSVTVTNRGDAPMPFSLGFHPALAWPLPGADADAVHRVRFAAAEPQPVRRIVPVSGLLLPDAEPTPVVGDTLVPTAAMFAADALIWDHLASRRVDWGIQGGPSITIDFPDSPMLGIWQKPGAPFLCIEPWAGHADPLGFAGDFHDRPGGMVLPRGSSRTFGMDLTLHPG